VSPSRKTTSLAAAFGALGTIASIWWFALRPRRKKRSAT
jgi:cbb3-type cytochrome oxidase subunit 3